MLVRRFQPEDWVEIARGQRRKPRRHSAIAELEIILELPINSLLHSNPKQGRRPTTGTSQSSSQANRRGAGPQARLSFTQDCRKHTIRTTGFLFVREALCRTELRQRIWQESRATIPEIRFWRPAVCQLAYSPAKTSGITRESSPADFSLQGRRPPQQSRDPNYGAAGGI